MHVTIPKGIVGGFEFTFVQRNLKEWHLKPWTYVCECYRKATQINSTAAIIRNSVLIISHVTFRDCRVHIFSDNLSRNNCILFISKLRHNCCLCFISKNAILGSNKPSLIQNFLCFLAIIIFTGDKGNSGLTWKHWFQLQHIITSYTNIWYSTHCQRYGQ